MNRSKIVNLPVPVPMPDFSTKIRKDKEGFYFCKG
jgi:hypothetical protein